MRINFCFTGPLNWTNGYFSIKKKRKKWQSVEERGHVSMSICSLMNMSRGGRKLVATRPRRHRILGAPLRFSRSTCGGLAPVMSQCSSSVPIFWKKNLFFFYHPVSDARIPWCPAETITFLALFVEFVFLNAAHRLDTTRFSWCRRADTGPLLFLTSIRTSVTSCGIDKRPRTIPSLLKIQ